MRGAAATDELIGSGTPDADLAPEKLHEIVESALSKIAPGEKVLAIVPDKTRDDNTDLLFPFAFEFLRERKVERFDVLVAQGTHAPMSEAAKRSKLGIGDGRTIPEIGTVLDHRWNDESELMKIGELSVEHVSNITGGLIHDPIDIRINKLLAPGLYDHVLIFGSTSPHEVAGFSGGAKYFFPGVSGRELTNATHWLGALAGIENTIGRIETPVRRLIEAAAEFVTANVICFTTAVTRTAENRLQTHALFAGDIRKSFRAAAAVSAQVHIKHTGRTYRRVIAILDERYDELWLGGKASYKLGAIIEDGGELIIYAPHLSCFSNTHGHLIEKYGYGGISRMKQLVADSAELRDNLCVAAHLAHVVYAERMVRPECFTTKYTIRLASQIERTACEKVNLGYLDPEEFDMRDYENDDDALIVTNAGRDLYVTN
jgi:nickel-dependent lactate racemase